MGTCHVMVGNIASGKSTRVKHLGIKHVVSKDALRYIIGNGDYLFDPALEPFIRNATSALISLYSRAGIDFVVDETHISSKVRKRTLQHIHPSCRIICHVGVDRGENSHVVARMKDNHGNTSEDKWREVYQMYNAAFEPPDLSEGFDEIRFIDFK